MGMTTVIITHTTMVIMGTRLIITSIFSTIDRTNITTDTIETETDHGFVAEKVANLK